MNDGPFTMVEQPAEAALRAVEIGGQTYALAPAVAAHLDELQLAWEGAESRVEFLASEMRWFCGRVERGEIRSVKTYTSFMHALMLVRGEGWTPSETPRGDAEQIERENRAGILSFCVGLVLGVASAWLVAGWIP